MVINNTKLESLGGEAPITCMTGLPAMSPLAPIVLNVDMGVATISEIQELKAVHFQELIGPLDNIHRRANDAATKKRGGLENLENPI
jgi:hypothetical protein